MTDTGKETKIKKQILLLLSDALADMSDVEEILPVVQDRLSAVWISEIAARATMLKKKHKVSHAGTACGQEPVLTGVQSGRHVVSQGQGLQEKNTSILKVWGVSCKKKKKTS